MAAAPSPVIRKPSILRPIRRKSPSASLPGPIVNVLRLLVVVLVFWNEYGTFWNSVRRCKWDDAPTPLVWEERAKELERIGRQGQMDEFLPKEDHTKDRKIEPFHVLIAADPQLLDMRSYPGRPWLFKWLGVLVTDAYARKAWKFVARKSKGTGEGTGIQRGVDGVVWLGDLLDSGVESVDRREHSHYVHRFHLLFPRPRPTNSHFTATKYDAKLTPPVPAIFLPGNHDLGLHLSSSSLAGYGRERFTDAFGTTSGQVEWGGWDIIWIDSMALLEQGDVAAEARSFVEDFARSRNTAPRILLTHIPLFRPEGTYCGKDRESGRSLRQGSGKNYQNEIDQATSDWLLKSIAPTLVYSGDDHDLCVVDHQFAHPSSKLTSIKETTVKAFSMAMGVRRPGYHLLSLYPPTSQDPTSAKFSQMNCTLPDQLGIWLNVYLPIFILLAFAVVLPKIWRLSRDRIKRSSTMARSNGLPVHNHNRSLSRKLFARAGVGSSRNGMDNDLDGDAEDSDSQFPTFPFTPTSSGYDDSYGYHSGLDSEELPTRNNSFSMESSGAGGGDGPGRVRRVSRVWLWEEGQGRSPFSDISGSEDFSQFNGSPRGGGRSRGTSPMSKAEELLNQVGLGFISRQLIRPTIRLLRLVLRKVFGPTLVKGFRWILSFISGGRMLNEVCGEIWDVIWLGVAEWVLLGLWFMF